MMTLAGSICAIATPFAHAGAIDDAALRRLVDYQIDQGTQALVVAGSTGEAHFLDEDEYAHLLQTVIAHAAGRVPIIAGTGEAGTQGTISMARRAQDLGADAALVVAPYYVRPTQEGMHGHFTAVAEAISIPVIAYNVPSRTSCDLLPQTVAGIRDHANIIGIKEAVSDGPRLLALAALATSDFAFLSGDDYSAALAMLAGAEGTISVVANIVPGPFRQLCDAARKRDCAATMAWMRRLDPLLQALTCAPNPVPVKAGLAMLGLGDGSVRMPLLQLTDNAQLTRIRDSLAALVPDHLVA